MSKLGYDACMEQYEKDVEYLWKILERRWPLTVWFEGGGRWNYWCPRQMPQSVGDTFTTLAAWWKWNTEDMDTYLGDCEDDI